MTLFHSLLCRSIGVAIAVTAISSIASTQTNPDTLPKVGETSKTEPFIAGTQTDPTPRVRVLVPCPVGSPADIFARRLAQILSESSGRQFYVENVASGAVNPATVQEALADGSTIFFGSADPTQPSACGD